MSTKLVLSAAALVMIGAGAALAQSTTAPAPARPGTTAPAPAPRATTPAPAPAPRAATPAPAPAPRAATPAAPAAAAAIVNLNTAPESDLDKLPQIGPARAKAIVEARTKGGRFKNWDDFVARNVVPKNAEEAIKARVRF